MAIHLADNQSVRMALQIPMNPTKPALQAVELQPGTRYMVNIRAARPLTPVEFESLRDSVEQVKAALEDDTKTVILMVHGPEIETIEIETAAETPDGPAS